VSGETGYLSEFDLVDKSKVKLMEALGGKRRGE